MRSKLGLERLCNTCNCHSTKGSRRSSCFYDIFGFWIRQRFRDCCFFWGKRENYGKLGSYDVESVGSQPFLLVSRITYIYIPNKYRFFGCSPTVDPQALAQWYLILGGPRSRRKACEDLGGAMVSHMVSMGFRLSGLMLGG